MYLISACLVGINCKYNGKNNFNQKAFDLVNSGVAIPICPEQFGGLPTPRIASEIRIIDGKKHVFNKAGEEVTENFQRGANEVLQLAKKLNVEGVILQSRSPSCGIDKIYSGNFDGTLVNGDGITAELLKENNINVIDIENV